MYPIGQPQSGPPGPGPVGPPSSNNVSEISSARKPKAKILMVLRHIFLDLYIFSQCF